MKLSLATAAAATTLLAACSSPLAPSGPQPKPGMAIVKGGAVFVTPASAQYSYVIGADGLLFSSWTGARDIAPGRHRFVFGASHASGLKSCLEVSLDVREGGQYLVEAANWSGADATYIIYELPGRKEIHRASAPLMSIPENEAGSRFTEMLAARGWRSPQQAPLQQPLPPQP